MLDLAFEQQLPQILHPLGIEDAVEMVAFVLHHARMEALGRAHDPPALGVIAGVADVPRPLDPAAQARHRKTPLPAAFRSPGPRFRSPG